MRVKLLVNYGKKQFGDIVDLDAKELKAIGVGNYAEVGEDVEVPKSGASDCSELQAKLDEANKDIDKLLQDVATKDEEIKELSEKIEQLVINEDEILRDLHGASKIAEYEAVKVKYPLIEG